MGATGEPLTDEQYELYERIAIMHFDGGLSLSEAERKARAEHQRQKSLF